MGAIDQSVFRASALASGLVTQDELNAALAALAKSSVTVDDETLAKRLVASGHLNTWQVEQLKSGRSKFNLGPYHVIDSIGKGGMGHVFKAEHSLMGRIVAVKVLPRSKATPAAINSFTQEIRNQAQLDNEHLVRAYDAGHDGNVFFLVTEYVPGADLRKFIRRRGRLSMAAAASIISQAAQGLAHAHGRGIIHRDVKPGNILITPDGRAKISDLGLAGCFQEGGDSATAGGKIVGTADYLAPEQILTPNQLTPATDIYALGCTLYYAVTGKVPFPGGTAAKKARAHCNLEPLDPRRLSGDLDDEFVDVIADMMTKDPRERIDATAEVVRRLSPWADPAAIAREWAASQAERAPETPTLSPRRPRAPIHQDDDVSFLIEPNQETGPIDSPSQGDVHTRPVSSASSDTIFDFVEEPEYELRSPRRALPSEVVVAIVIGAVAAALALAVVAMSLL